MAFDRHQKSASSSSVLVHGLNDSSSTVVAHEREIKTLSQNKFTKVNVSRVAIIGDGPTALMLAINLIQDGFSGLLHIIGSRLGQYTRSGNINPEVFTKASAAIAPLKVNPSSSYHIKDIERECYAHLMQLIKDEKAKCKIEFHQDYFLGFDREKQIRIGDKEEKITKIIKVDLIHECTGYERAVIKKFNEEVKAERIKAPAFEVKSFGDNPFKSYGFIRLITSPGQGDKFSTDFHHQPLNIALTLANLRELGWSYFYLPTCHARFKPKKNSALEKCNLYLQLPDDLRDSNQALEFLRILYKFYDRDCKLEADGFPKLELHHESKKYGSKKPVVSIFSVSPSFVTPSSFLGNIDTPIIIHHGDATANPPFFTGKSLISGISRYQNVRSAFQYENGMIVGINVNLIHQSYEENITSLSSLLNDKYRSHRKIIAQSKTEALSGFFSVYKDNEMKISLTDKNKLIGILKDLTQDEIPQWIQRSRFHLSRAELADQEFVNSHELLEEIMQYHSVLSPELLQNAEHLAQDIANKAKDLGNSLLKTNQYTKASNYYVTASFIYAKYLPNTAFDEKLILFSNMIILHIKLSDYASIIRKMDDFKKILPRIDLNNESNRKILEKVSHNFIRAILATVKKAVKVTNPNKDTLKELIEEANGWLGHIRTPAYHERFKLDLDAVQAKIAPTAAAIENRNSGPQ